MIAAPDGGVPTTMGDVPLVVFVLVANCCAIFTEVEDIFKLIVVVVVVVVKFICLKTMLTIADFGYWSVKMNRNGAVVTNDKV